MRLANGLRHSQTFWPMLYPNFPGDALRGVFEPNEIVWIYKWTTFGTCLWDGGLKYPPDAFGGTSGSRIEVALDFIVRELVSLRSGPRKDLET